MNLMKEHEGSKKTRMSMVSRSKQGKQNAKSAAGESLREGVARGDFAYLDGPDGLAV
jgi:hypothetical protein